MTTAFTETQILEACHTLFGSEICTSRAFLFYIQPSGVKSAYRKKAKETHPDIAAGQDPFLQKQQAAVFIDILKAYDVLNTFFKEREEGRWLEKADARVHGVRPAATPKPPRSSDSKYSGRVPQQPLEFGRYVYYRGYITYATLIQALGWQRTQRPVIGTIAQRWGWLNSPGIDQIIAARHISGRFGEKAMSLGLLSPFQVKTLLFYQRSQQQKLGQYFVKHGLLGKEELDLLLGDLHEHNNKILAQMLRRSREQARAV